MTRAGSLLLTAVLACSSAPEPSPGEPSESSKPAPVDAPAPASAPKPADRETPAEAGAAEAGRTPPLESTADHDGLHWTTRVHVERRDADLELVARVEVDNRSKAPAPVALEPNATVQITLIPGVEPKGLGMLGIRGEGWGSGICSTTPGPHGTAPVVSPGQSRSHERRVGLDPLPWPDDHGYRVTLAVMDCRDRTKVQVADVVVVPPTDPGGLPSLQVAPESDGEAPAG